MKRLALLLLLTACGVLQAKQYEKIISLAPSITRQLTQLGMENKVAGRTIFCPRGTPTAVTVGNMLQPDIEKILSISPDLAIVTKEGNSPQTVEKLKKLGIRVYVMDSTDNFAGICAEFIKLGAFLGKQEQANTICALAVERVDSARKRANERKKNLSIFWQVGAHPLFTAGKNSYFNDISEIIGCRNVFGGLSSRFSAVNREEVVRRNPDTIIIVDMAESADDEKKYWLSFKTLKATAGGKVIVVQDPAFTDPTPTGFAESVLKTENLIWNKNE